MLPREKIKLKGVKSLENYELLSVILGSGTRKENVFELSARLLRDYLGSSQFLNYSYGDLRNNLKISEVKSLQIMAISEIVKRFSENHQSLIDQPIINNSKKVYQFLINNYSHNLNGQEEVHLFVVDSAIRLTSASLISKGNSNKVIVSPADIVKSVLNSAQTRFIITHNHPADSLKPSSQDKEFTQNLEKCSKMIGLQFLDHIIWNNNGYFSFVESNLM